MSFLKYSVILAVVLAFSSCVDVKIAANLPQNQYFSLQKLDSESSSVDCKANAKNINKGKIGLLDIQANAPYDGIALILYNAKSLQISELSGKKWINSPKEMLKTNLLQALNKSCYQSTIAPFGTQTLNKIIKITILSLQVIETQNLDSENFKAQLSIFYEIFDSKSHTQSKSGIITRELTLADSALEGQGDIKKEAIKQEGEKVSNSLAQSFSKLSDEVIAEVLKKL